MNKQLPLFEVAIEPKTSSIATPAIEQNNLTEVKYKTAKHQYIQKYLQSSLKEAIVCVGTYLVRGKHEYFRLSYRQGTKMKHIHIKGGSTISELAQHRAQKLQSMIDRGAELAEILAAVNTYNGTKPPLD